MMEESGECSGAKPSEEVWAKLVPSDSRYSDVEIRSGEVDGAEVLSEDTVVIKDGSEIIPGPDREGFVGYKFSIMSSPETSQRQLKILVDVEHAECCICLNIWHDVVTIAPCLHNFCNGCFSKWLRRLQEKNSTVLCPQCRAVVQFVGKNHFLRNIAEDMLKADSSLRRSDEEVALLDSCSSVRSNLVFVSLLQDFASLERRSRRLRKKVEEKFRYYRECNAMFAERFGVQLPPEPADTDSDDQ